MSGIVQTLNNLTYSKEKLSDGRIKFEVEVAQERFSTAKQAVFKRLAPTVKISGFRPGKAPENVIAAQLGPKLYEETLGRLLPEATLEIIQKEGLTPLDQIEYKIEKVAEGSGAKYTATVSVMPEISLPDISKFELTKPKEETVTDEEVQKVIQQMYQEQHKDTDDTAKKEGTPDDEWVASLNLGVDTLDDLKEKIKGELKRQKSAMTKNKQIDELMNKIMKETEFDIPQTLVDREVEAREEEYKKRIDNLGMKVEDFLRNQKVTLEDLKKDWKKDAEKKVRAEMILLQAAKDYGIKVKEKEIDAQVQAVQDPKLRKQYETPQARRYLQSVLMRQKVVQKMMQEVGKKSK